MSRLVMSEEFPGTIACSYELDLLPGWRPSNPSDHAENAPRPYCDLPRWSGKSDNGTLPVPPAIGDRVVVNFNGFGVGTVTGYFVEHGWLGCHVRCDHPPLWWKEQNSADRERQRMPIEYRGPMVFGNELKGV